MLTHIIARYEEPMKVKKEQKLFRGIYGSEEHKRFIHKRVLKRCMWQEGDHVLYRGKLGVVVDILLEDAFDVCPWKDLECLCVEVFVYELNDSVFVHPNSLEKNK